jgi:hypothetical protein
VAGDPRNDFEQPSMDMKPGWLWRDLVRDRGLNPEGMLNGPSRSGGIANALGKGNAKRKISFGSVITDGVRVVMVDPQ